MNFLNKIFDFEIFTKPFIVLDIKSLERIPTSYKNIINMHL